jgi:hypothetical protein
MARFSIITPTYPHEHCRLTVIWDLLKHQLGTHDEWLIYSDGPSQIASDLAHHTRDPRIRWVQTPETRQNGNAQREAAIRDAQGDFLWFMDDSMLPIPWALESMRARIHERRPHFFRIYYAGLGGEIRWVGRNWHLGSHDVSAAMLVTPNDPDRLGSWHLADRIQAKSSPYGSSARDGNEWRRAGGYFVDATLSKYSTDPVWCHEVISVWFE